MVVTRTNRVSFFSGHFRKLSTQNEVAPFWPESNSHTTAKQNKGEHVSILNESGVSAVKSHSKYVFTHLLPAAVEEG